MFRRRLTVGCPICGGFWEGVDALHFARLMSVHPLLTSFGFDADYQRWVDDLISGAEAALA